MADLPQELIDKIIDEVAQPNFVDTLRACCLVQKRWVERSRSHLFQEIDLYFKVRFRDWVKFIPPGPNGPCRHVRSLTYRQGMTVIGPEQLLDLYPRHFISFTRLKSLQIFTLSLPWFTPTSMKKVFGPVGGFVRTLVIINATLTLNSLLTFLIHFPRLEALNIGSGLKLTPEKKKRPQNLPNLTGELILNFVGSVSSPFVLGLSKLPLRYSELDVNFRWHSDVLNAVAHLILTCSPTLEKISLQYSPTLLVEGTPNVSNSSEVLTHARRLTKFGRSQMTSSCFPSTSDRAPSSEKSQSKSREVR